jgi:hypothetical protein
MATAADTQLFVYKGKNRKGEKVEGELRADNLSLAKGQLRKQGIISTSLKKKPKPLFSRKKENYSRRYRTIYSPAGNYDESRRAAGAVLRYCCRRCRQ